MDELFRQAISILRGMWQRRWWGLAVAWLVAAVAAVVVWRIPEQYEARARVYVDTQTVLRPLLAGLAVQPDVEQQVGMLARTLMTRPNMERIARSADLDLRARSPQQTEALVDGLMRQLRLSSGGRENLYEISYRDRSPETAQRVVQSLVSLFVESGLGEKRRDAEQARRFVEEQIKHYDEKLRESEDRLKEFKLRNFGLLGATNQDYFARVSTLSEEVSKVRMELRIAEESRDSLQRQLAGEEPTLVQAEIAPVVATGSIQIEERLMQARRALDELERRYTPQHPDVMTVRRQIEQLEEQKAAELEARRKAAAAKPGRPVAATNPVYQQIKISLAEAEAQVAALRARLASMQSQLDQLRANANRIPQLEAELVQLNRDYDVLKQNYQALVSRRESALMAEEVDASVQMADFRVIDPPRATPRPVFPNRPLLIAVALLAALGAGAAVALGLSQLFPRVADATTLRTIAQRPVLGTISMQLDPRMMVRARLGMAAFASGVFGLVAAHGAWAGWVLMNARA
jgi:polysaccharide chain length determinant protein (PEP-CTERM system associated)